MTVTTRQKLLTNSWTADVAAFETSIERFTDNRTLRNGCEVMFFEIPSDGDLHVNVTHQLKTKDVPGWAGPGKRPSGFVHNRRFGAARPTVILRHIRDMVFAGTA